MIRTWKEGDTVTCYEITHAGEGERGRSLKVLGHVQSGEHAAKIAAVNFDVMDKRKDGLKEVLCDSDLNGRRYVIEVVGVYDVPVRYRVRCDVAWKCEAFEDVPG